MLVVLCMPGKAHTQSTAKIFRKAETSFASHDYYSAAKLYAAILYDSPLVAKSASLVYPFQPANRKNTRKIKASKKAYAQYRLAESYRLNYHYSDAVPQYEQYLSSQDTRFPEARLWYGNSLLATDQPEKAITAFNTFLQKHKIDDSLTQKARLGIADANFRISTRALPPQAVITKINAASSVDGSNFALEKNENDSFRFTSSRHEIDQQKEKFYPVRLYTGSAGNNTVEKMNSIPAGDMNMAASSLSQDGLTLYFTGWKEDKRSLPTYYRIFYTTRASAFSKWNVPVALAAPVNIPGFNSKQPFISRDNQYLFFASDRPGGFGKYDIWMVDLNSNGMPGTAVNAGDHINTNGEEASPFYDADSSYLYYSSDGRTGMGGMDIYKIKGKPNDWTGSSINLGHPLNSVKDDLYYTKQQHSDTAYLSSDRASACCLEIFKAVHLHIKDSLQNTAKLPEYKILPPVKQQDTMNRHLMDSINAVTIDRMHVNYNFASSKIRKADRPQLDHIVQMLKQDSALHILVASFTDCIGSQAANTRLSRKRSESVKAYLAEKGISLSRINIDFFGKKHFIMACREDNSYNQQQQIANRRSDLIVTTEKNPVWRPSGKELDVQKMLPDSLTRLANLTPAKNRELNNQQQPAGAIANNNQPARVTGAEKNNNSQLSGVYKKQTDTVTSLAQKNTGLPNKPAETSLAVAGKEKNAGLPNKPAETSLAVSGKEKNPTVDAAGTSKYNNDRNAKQRSIASNKAGDELLTTNKKRSKQVKTAAPPPMVRAVPEMLKKPTMQKSTDSVQIVMRISDLLDITPRLKRPTIIEQMTSRTPRKSFEVFSTSDSVRVDLYDNGVFDYDTVSVIYNKELVIYKQMLQTNKPIRFYVKLDSDQRKNEMIFFAENLGLTPPNSALMIITDGDNKRTEVNVSSDLQHNAVIYFIKVKKQSGEK
jgi:outer membrane protein OmpA-like peptidoglycan-associated protein